MTSKVIVALVLAYSAATAADIRRVVTALDGHDKAIVLFDSHVTLEPGNAPSAKLWVTDTAPAGISFTDDSGAKPTPLPPDSARRCSWLNSVDPTEEAKMDIGERTPARGLPVRHPLMHRTRTVDYGVVLSGEIDMMLDNSVTHVRAGDVIIHQATNHAWINRDTQACRILFALIDSRQP